MTASKHSISLGQWVKTVKKDTLGPKPCNSKTLAKAKEGAWKAMHSYTHGGLHQISRKIQTSTIEPVIDNEEIEEIICFAELISTLSFSAMIAMSKDSGKDNVIKKFIESVSQECFNK